MKPFSEASERNREPIVAELRRILSRSKLVLEIGSGTGQHAAYFAPALAHLAWQPSDVAEHLPGIRAWVDEAGAPNLRAPVELDVDAAWPALAPDAVYSANTCHIMSWLQVRRMFAGIGGLQTARLLCLYGPFNYGGRHTSESNARFDAMLRARDPQSGLRDIEALVELGRAQGFSLDEDHAMPANNRLLVFARN
jgi:hypothetical protein